MAWFRPVVSNGGNFLPSVGRLRLGVDGGDGRVGSSLPGRPTKPWSLSNLPLFWVDGLPLPRLWNLAGLASIAPRQRHRRAGLQPLFDASHAAGWLLPGRSRVAGLPFTRSAEADHSRSPHLGVAGGDPGLLAGPQPTHPTVDGPGPLTQKGEVRINHIIIPT